MHQSMISMRLAIWKCLKAVSLVNWESALQNAMTYFKILILKSCQVIYKSIFLFCLCYDFTVSPIAFSWYDHPRSEEGWHEWCKFLWEKKVLSSISNNIKKKVKEEKVFSNLFIIYYSNNSTTHYYHYLDTVSVCISIDRLLFHIWLDRLLIRLMMIRALSS